MAHIPNTIRAKNYNKACKAVEERLYHYLGESYRPLTMTEMNFLSNIALGYMTGLSTEERKEYRAMIREILPDMLVPDEADLKEYKIFIQAVVGVVTHNIFFDGYYYQCVNGEEEIA